MDRKVLKASDITGMLNALTTAINTSRIAPESFEKLCIDYRQLLEAPVIELMSNADPLIVGIVAFGGWFPCGNTMLLHDSSHANASNANGGNYPVVIVKGAVGFVGATRGGGVPTSVCLGVSTNGGVSWTPLDGTAGMKNSSRQLGANAGRAMPFYSSPSQVHYMTGVGGYRPKNYPSEKMVELQAAFGGDRDSFGNPTLYNAYCIMTDGALTDSCQAWAWLTLDAREQGF